MKWLLIFSVLIFIGIVVTYFVPVDVSKEIRIAANFDNCVEQVIHPANWKNWHPGIKKYWEHDSSGVSITRNSKRKGFTISTGGIRYEIEMVTPVSYVVEKSGDYDANIFEFTILPCLSPDSVWIRVKSRMSLLQHLMPFLSTTTPSTPVQHLKSYLEDSVAFYGFPMQFRKVENPFYITHSFTTDKKNLFGSLATGFSSIEKFISEKSLKAVSAKSVSYKAMLRDSVTVLAGMAIDRQSPTNGPLQTLIMPNGRMLTAVYEGRFDKRAGIYTAMRKYIADHHLAQVSVEYEEYLDNRLPENDSSMVSIRVFFPIL